MMNKNEVKEMNVLQVEESLLAVTRIYIRMHGTSVPATDTELPKQPLNNKSEKFTLP